MPMRRETKSSQQFRCCSPKFGGGKETGRSASTNASTGGVPTTSGSPGNPRDSPAADGKRHLGYFTCAWNLFHCYLHGAGSGHTSHRHRNCRHETCCSGTRQRSRFSPRRCYLRYPVKPTRTDDWTWFASSGSLHR